MHLNIFAVFAVTLCLWSSGLIAADSHANVSSSDHHEVITHATDTHGNATQSGSEHHEEEEDHHEEEEDHHEEEEHHEEHHSGHAIIWPSAFAMMGFITLSGYLFYKYYSRAQMKKFLKKYPNSFYERAIISSALAGAAAPGLVGFNDEKK